MSKEITYWEDAQKFVKILFDNKTENVKITVKDNYPYKESYIVEWEY